MEKEPSKKYWMGWYIAVFVFLLAQVIFFLWVTNHF